jgi:hypothetical protein
MVEIRVEKTKSSPARYSHNIRPLSSLSSNPLKEALCESFTQG